jgi:FkbM family methyltransferase
VSHAVRALRNAFFSPGRRLFGPRFSWDYLRLAWRAARSWGASGEGTIDFLGCRLDYSNQSHAVFLVHEIFVNAAYVFDSPNPRPRVLDCGANIGVAVLFFKKFRPDAYVIAFEPDPTAFAHLVRTIQVNGLRCVQAENVAVSEKEGVVAFYGDASDPGSLTSSLKPSWGGDARQEVRAVRLSTWIREPIDFLKLDVEGSEYGVIRDLIDTNAIRWVREAAIEYHELDAKPDAVSRMTRALRASGFEVRVTAADAQHRIGMIRARRVSRPSGEISPRSD